MGKTISTARTPYGERLVLARVHANLTQPQLAKLAKMSQSNLSELERTGQGSAKTATIAEITGVRSAWLESGTGSMVDTTEIPPQVQQVASEKVAHYLVGTPAGSDYRTIALSLAAALEETGTELSVSTFIKLLEATYAKLKP